MTSRKSIQLLVVLLITVHLLVACGRDESSPGAGSTPAAAAPAPTEAPTEAPVADPATVSAAEAVELPGDPQAAILQALRAQLTAGPYRTTTTIDMEGGAQTMVGTVVPPDRMHVVMNLGDVATEMIYIGDKVWSKQGDAAWVASDRMGTPGAGLLDDSMIADTERTITEAALVGPDVIEGVDALVYSFTTDLNKSEIMPLDSVIRSKIWIDTATGLIVRQEIEDTTADTPSTTVQVIEYDPAITIEPPVQ